MRHDAGPDARSVARAIQPCRTGGCL